MIKFIFFNLIIVAQLALGSQTDINLNIKLIHDNKSEQQGKELLLGFVKKYDLAKYIFTHEIIIESKVIPHSHPVLTLNTRTINEPDRYLSGFLHEEIHWFFASKSDARVNRFVEIMKRQFPNAPVGVDNGGAHSEFSTYLHLGVCYYELKALSGYIGDEKAVKVFETDKIYPWIRKQVLNNGNSIAAALHETALVL